MKRMKKLTSLFLAALMVIAMAMPVFATQADSNTTQAEKGDFTITINDATEGYVYGAYQIFTADLDNSDEVLSNIQWGSAIDPSKVADVFGADTTAASVAQALAAASKNEAGNLVDDNAAAQEYAAKFAQCLYTTEKTEVVDGVEKTVTVIDNTKATKSGAQENNVYKISGLTAGYYLVLNESIPANGAATRYILEVVKDQIVTPKRDVLIKDKDIVKLAPEGAVKVDEAPIGKVENFRVWAKLPSNYDSYKEYYLVFRDYLTKGFDYDASSVKVYATKNISTDPEKVDFDLTNAVDITSHFYTNQEPGQYKNKDVTAITIGIQNLKWVTEAGVGENANDYIVVTYSATLNNQAVVGVEGNPNYVIVDYSNDPNNSGTGEPEEPDKPEEPKPTHPTGVTPESKTETYTTQLTIFKYETVNGEKQPLPGAGFTLTGKGVQVSLVAEEEFVKNDNGIYWKLKDDTYTTTAPTIADDETDNQDDYDSVTQKYSRGVTIAQKDGESNNYSIQGIIDENGYITFTGLGKGDYELEETIVPSGFNTWEKKTFSISFDATTHEFSSTGDLQLGKANNVFTTEIENKRGSLLPSTGGIGTTIFYVVGTILVLGAGILLVTKRRMKAQ